MGESKRHHLHDAADLVESAAGRVDGDPADRLDDLAEQIQKAADRSHGPDHGRLARLLTALEEVKGQVDDETGATIEDARDHLTEFRKTVEGV